MPVPRLIVPEHKVNEIQFKVNYIIRTLIRKGYDIGDARDAVRIIELESRGDKYASAKISCTGT